MGMRYKNSGKLMPAGIMTGLRSESDVLPDSTNCCANQGLGHLFVKLADAVAFACLTAC